MFESLIIDCDLFALGLFKHEAQVENKQIIDAETACHVQCSSQCLLALLEILNDLLFVLSKKCHSAVESLTWWKHANWQKPGDSQFSLATAPLKHNDACWWSTGKTSSNKCIKEQKTELDGSDGVYFLRQSDFK